VRDGRPVLFGSRNSTNSSLSRCAPRKGLRSDGWLDEIPRTTRTRTPDEVWARRAACRQHHSRIAISKAASPEVIVGRDWLIFVGGTQCPSRFALAVAAESTLLLRNVANLGWALVIDLDVSNGLRWRNSVDAILFKHLGSLHVPLLPTACELFERNSFLFNY
jgi:hypothetical protein